MKIQLTKTDIDNAVHAYVAELGIPVDGKFVGIEFSTKRTGGAGGLIADVTILDEAPEPVKGKEESAPKVRKPRGPNKAKALTDAVSGTVGAAIVGQTQGATSDKKTVALAEAIENAKAENQGNPQEGTQTAVVDDPVPVVANNPQPTNTSVEVPVEEVKTTTTTSLFS